MMNKKGFTLVELMVVIVIIGVLAAVAIPKFSAATNKAKASELPSVISQIVSAQEVYQTETNAYATAATGGYGIADAANTLTSVLGVDAQKSKYFTYNVYGAELADGSDIFLIEGVSGLAFGGLTVGTDVVSVDELGNVGATALMQNYVRSFCYSDPNATPKTIAAPIGAAPSAAGTHNN